MTPAPAAPPHEAAPRAGRGGEVAADAAVASQYRRFLLGTAVAIYVGAAAELALVGHYEGWTQVVPFVLIALGLGAVLWAHIGSRAGGAQPGGAQTAGAGRRALLAVRLTSALVVAGSVVGVGLHVRGNFAFEREIHPAAPLGGALWEAARGASPLLAPGALALAGVLAAAAMWRHPALRQTPPPRPPGA
ncbi:hypothetical protein RQM47_14855 [Rubrivirga sp. S365]|uniref:Uncharacterized protein n=1 Tax=Rubrivirga litoralis TaxID=3075598 RepID=A0ABU3BRF1_9BACT|nr:MULTISPECIES: hypothetical protein [unclassified Rubrivirga]MDT0631870.1 hypothetical protein [Rubrivirga sp. F394]MDT7857923.1 hypothetical protein [Rubrivirga sp. S365]